MKITNLKIRGFGKLHNKDIDFKDGINVVHGKNEAGKSTTHSFIKAMLFGISKKKGRASTDTFNKYKPWDDHVPYEGLLSYDYGDKSYTITRNFDGDTLKIVNSKKNTRLTNPDLFLLSCLSNLNEISYDNTVSISQFKNATESKMIAELKRYISNLNTSGDLTINTIAAINYLKHERKSYEDLMKKDLTIIYNKTLGSIKILEKELDKEEYKNIMGEISDRKNSENEKIRENKLEIEKLKNQINTDNIFIRRNGFESKEDIDILKTETQKIYIEYKNYKKFGKRFIKIFSNVLSIIAGLLLGVASTLMLFVTYPNVARMLGVYPFDSSFDMIGVFLSKMPLSPTPTIGIFYCISLMFLISGIVYLINNLSTGSKLEDATYALAEIFNHQLGTPVVNEENMLQFKKHITQMYGLINNITEAKNEIDRLNKENENLLLKQEEYLKSLEDQQRLQFEVEEKVQNLNNLRTEADKLKKDLDYNEAIEKEIDSINLAIDMLNELASKVKVMFGTHLNKRSSDFIKGLTNGKYDSLNVDDSLNITINTEDRTIDIDKVSGGAMHQIYLAVRLATAELIQGKNEPLPLVFDDCFTMYDDERLESALKYLYDNYKGQIIIFSCHTREYEILEKLNIPHNTVIIE